MAKPTFYLDPTWTGLAASVPTQSKFTEAAFGTAWMWGGDSVWSQTTNNGIYYYVGYIGTTRTLPHIPFTTTKPTSSQTLISGMPLIWRDPDAPTRGWGAATRYWWYTAAPIAISPLVLNADPATVDPLAWVDSGGPYMPWSWSIVANSNPKSAYYAGAVRPAIAYVWRPSTQTVLGVLWNILPIGLWHNLASNRITSETGGVLYHRAQSYVNYSDIVGPSVNIQSGDMIIFEWWAFNIYEAIPSVPGTVIMDESLCAGGGTDAANNTAVAWEATGTLVHNSLVQPNLDGYTVGGTSPSSGGALGPPANLITVTPRTGPTLRLGFDNPVGITGPTIGAATAGVGCTGATQIAAATIDLALAIRPDQPSGDADYPGFAAPVAEADVMGPPVVTGAGAKVI